MRQATFTWPAHRYSCTRVPVSPLVPSKFPSAPAHWLSEERIVGHFSLGHVLRYTPFGRGRLGLSKASQRTRQPVNAGTADRLRPVIHAGAAEAAGFRDSARGQPARSVR